MPPTPEPLSFAHVEIRQANWRKSAESQNLNSSLIDLYPLWETREEFRKDWPAPFFSQIPRHSHHHSLF